MGALKGAAHPHGHHMAQEGLLKAVWPQGCPHMAPIGKAAASSPDPEADPEGRVQGVWLEILARAWLWSWIQAVLQARGTLAGQGHPGRSGQGWDGKGGAGAGPGGIPRRR